MRGSKGAPRMRPAKNRGLAPTFAEEAELWVQGFQWVAGIDEAGRGPLAGPVVAAAVVLSSLSPHLDWWAGVRDSKLLPPERREELAALIRGNSLAAGIGVVSHTLIDQEGITKATRRAMALAVQDLARRPDFLLLDGREQLPGEWRQKAIVKGDRSVMSIAAASILAKVHRDRIMEELEAQYPGWGFGRHKGYSTREHLDALRRLGPSTVHRRSFAPVRQPMLVPLEAF